MKALEELPKIYEALKEIDHVSAALIEIADAATLFGSKELADKLYKASSSLYQSDKRITATLSTMFNGEDTFKKAALCASEEAHMAISTDYNFSCASEGAHAAR